MNSKAIALIITLIISLGIGLVFFFSAQPTKIKEKNITIQDILGTYDVDKVLKDTTGLTALEIIALALRKDVYTFRCDSIDITASIGALHNTATFAWSLRNDTIKIDSPNGQRIYSIRDTTGGFFLQNQRINILLTRR